MLILKSIIYAPPVNAAAVQISPIVDLVLSVVSSVKFMGESGEVVIIAPLPSFERSEFPYTFMATTLA